MHHPVAFNDLDATDVFVTYWRFAAERESIYEKRLRGEPHPCTDNAILSQHKFSDVFRVAGRVSQCLIRHVIYESGGSMEDECVVAKHF